MRLASIPVDSLSGVGERKKKDLAGLGIVSIWDLLTYFPYRYEDYSLSSLDAATGEQRVTVEGKIVESPSVRWYGKKKSRLAIRLKVDGNVIQAVWFNQAYLKEKLSCGQTILLSGKWDPTYRQLVVDRTFISEKEREENQGVLQPIYTVTGSIRMNWLRQRVFEAFEKYSEELEEILPAEFISRYKLMPRGLAMFQLHFPRTQKEQYLARRRMVYEELFLYELKILWLKKVRNSNLTGEPRDFDASKVEALISDLPFPLTGAQRRVVDEILNDLRSPVQMNRLLQGDVGSGKTVVATIALYANVLAGYQGALMVPTEILAGQHYLSLERALAPYDIRVVLLTGSMTTKERRQRTELLESGLAHIVVGTHALIQEPVTYHKLGFVIIDEQHRFGVKQRAILREKGENPDILFMTATPIPRTLSIAFFGEMDVSAIDEMPAGREPVHTYWVKRELWPRVIQFIEKECTSSRQAYVVCPLIQESEHLDLQNAEELYLRLKERLSPIQVGLLHGKMLPHEKDEVMAAFKENQIQVLVSTTVIEVGVNVPNATVMAVYDADRFGLAQLHQLRGRVGRGGGASTCILVANPKSEAGMQRMRVMTETTDGFEISRRDLELRGPGDFLGVKQSGLPHFKVADLMQDQKVLELTRSDASWLLKQEDFMTKEEYEPLRVLLSHEELENKNFD